MAVTPADLLPRRRSGRARASGTRSRRRDGTRHGPGTALPGSRAGSRRDGCTRPARTPPRSSNEWTGRASDEEATARRRPRGRPHDDVGRAVRHEAASPRWARTSSRSSRRGRGTTSARCCPSPAWPTRGTAPSTSTSTTATSGRSCSTLPTPRGRDAFLRVVAHCDVVIENYRADVLDKLGLGYDVLRAGRPDIILVVDGRVRQGRPRPRLRRLRARHRAHERPRLAHRLRRRRTSRSRPASPTATRWRVPTPPPPWPWR